MISISYLKPLSGQSHIKVALLATLRTSEYTIEDYFIFTKEVYGFSSKLVVASFVTLYQHSFARNDQPLHNPKDCFCELIAGNMSGSMILFDHDYYKLHDDVSIGSLY